MIKIYKTVANKKYYIYRRNTGGIRMGVSMGIIKPIEGSAAQQLIKESRSSSLDQKTLESCRKLASLISKK